METNHLIRNKRLAMLVSRKMSLTFKQRKD